MKYYNGQNDMNKKHYIVSNNYTGYMFVCAPSICRIIPDYHGIRLMIRMFELIDISDDISRYIHQKSVNFFDFNHFMKDRRFFRSINEYNAIMTTNHSGWRHVDKKHEPFWSDGLFYEQSGGLVKLQKKYLKKYDGERQ